MEKNEKIVIKQNNGAEELLSQIYNLKSKISLTSNKLDVKSSNIKNYAKVQRLDEIETTNCYFEYYSTFFCGMLRTI